MIRTFSKKLGQCFLEDRNILAKEAALAEISGKSVLEIGGGDGRLTEELRKKQPKKLFVVEKDERFASMLTKRFSDFDNVVIIKGDVLGIDLPEVDVVIGNIPYYISSDIIFRLKDEKAERIVFMVQKEFGEKMVAKPGEKNYGRLSVTSQMHFDVDIVQKVPKHLFRPRPKVDSVIIVLKSRHAKITEFQEDVIRFLFQHRNKTVRNALVHSKKFSMEQVSSIGELSKKRVRTLSKEECLEIANALYERKD